MEESRKRANEKWLKANYESITIRVPKGTKEQIKAWAGACGLSMLLIYKKHAKKKPLESRTNSKRTARNELSFLAL